MKAFIGCLILCGLYSTHSASVGVSLSSICAGKQNGVRLPVSGDCSQFYICMNGKEVLQSCGAEVHFDPENNRCVDASKSRCVKGQWISSSKPNTENLEKVEEIEKVKEQEEEEIALANICLGKAMGTFLPSRTSCSEFYVCIGNKPILKTCNKGLHYDVDAKACIDEKLSKCVVKVTKPVEVEEISKIEKPAEVVEAVRLDNQLKVNISVEEKPKIEAVEIANIPYLDETAQDDEENSVVACEDVKEVVCADQAENDETGDIELAVKKEDITNINDIKTVIGNVADIKSAIVGKADLKTPTKDIVSEEKLLLNDKIIDLKENELPVIKKTEIVPNAEAKNSPVVDSQVIPIPTIEKTKSPVEQITSIKNNALPVITKTDSIPIEEIELPVIDESEVLPVLNKIIEKTEVSPIKHIVSIKNNAVPVITKTDIIPIEEIELPVIDESEVSPVEKLLLNKKIIDSKEHKLPVIKKTETVSNEEAKDSQVVDNQAIPIPIIEKTEVSPLEQIMSIKNNALPVITKSDSIPIEEIELPESEVLPVSNKIIEKTEVSLIKKIISAIKNTEESRIDKADVVVISKDNAGELEAKDTGVDVGYADADHEEADYNTEVVLAVIDEDSADKCVGVASGVFLPKNGSCTEFITCQSGVAYVGQCPSGLHFNAKLNFCDWPELAGCEDITDIKSEVAEVVSVDEAEDNETDHVKLAVKKEDITTPTKYIVSEGKLRFNDNIINLKRPGLPVIKKTEIVSNEEAKVSPVDSQTNAVPIIEKTEVSPIKQIISNKNNAMPVITKTDIIPIEEIELPTVDKSEVSSVDNKVIEKTKVSPIKQVISVIKHTEDSHIDQADIVVISKDNANELEAHDTGVDVGYVDVNHEEGDDNTEVVLAVIDEDGADKCVGVAPGVFLPKAGSCTQFITCQSGVAFVAQCPAGLHFNAKLQACDWPELAGCAELQLKS